MAKKTTKQTKTTFGGCDYEELSPKPRDLSPRTPILNVTLSFEDALKLSFAIDECVWKLDPYGRSTAAGKRSALNLAVHLGEECITVTEGTL